MWVTKEFTFDAAHRLTFHEGLCSNPHGHLYKVHVGIEGELDNNGLVLDFKELKALKNWLDENWDHSYIHSDTDEVGVYLAQQGFRTFNFQAEPTAENMAIFLMHKAKELFDSLVIDLADIKITVWETPTSFATVFLSDSQTEDVFCE